MCSPFFSFPLTYNVGNKVADSAGICTHRVQYMYLGYCVGIFTYVHMHTRAVYYTKRFKLRKETHLSFRLEISNETCLKRTE